MQAAEGLPPKPSDPSGRDRHVSWVSLAAEPGFYYHDEFVEIDAAWIDGRIAIHRARAQQGFLPPILVVHKDAGEREGDILDLERVTLAGKETLIGALAWNDAGAAAKIETGRINDVSVGLYDLQDHATGEVLPMVVGEVSTTALPHLAGLAHILNQGVVMDPSVEDRLAAIEAMLAAIVDRLGPVEEPEVAEEPAEVEAMEEPDEEEEVTLMEGEPDDEEADPLVARVAELESKLAAAEEAASHALYMSELPIGATITLTAEVAEYIYPRWREDADGFAVLVENVTDPVVPVEPVAPVVQLTSPWTQRLGTADATPRMDGQAALAEARKRAKANGTNPSQELQKIMAATPELNKVVRTSAKETK